jgi:transposase
VPVADGEPGVECQIDFARMGMLFDSVSGRRRVVHALIFTAVYSRHMFVWLTFSQTLEAVIDGCEAAWPVIEQPPDATRRVVPLQANGWSHDRG